MMNVRGIQRNMKNVVKNYSDAQVKVREATSNDHWGPSSTLMSEIADLTYNVVAFSEIMQMIWKRLNDHGKNWRHVYKALVLLEYLIKTGSEKVAQQCKENIFAIQTLKDFQYIEENKDQGLNVREKSKALVALLKDDEKLKNERCRALKAKERFAQSLSHVSNSNSLETIPKTSVSYHESFTGLSPGSEPKPLAVDLENARPQTLGEEELQLQLALAMSKEEAEQEDRLRKNDDLRLQLAINESAKPDAVPAPLPQAKKSAIDDLLSLNPVLSGANSDPWVVPPRNGGLESFGAVGGISPNQTMNDPWSPSPLNMTPVNDPWNSQPVRSGSSSNDPWQPSPPTNNTPSVDPWLSNDNHKISSGNGEDILMNGPGLMALGNEGSIRKTPESFLGANSNLVNLDALVSTKNAPSTKLGLNNQMANSVILGMPISGNPFASTGTANPFQASKPPPPTINQLRSQTNFPSSAPNSAALGFNISQQINAGLSGQALTSSTGHLPASFTTSGNNPFAM